MAIETEFVSVIVCKKWIAEHYPGGLDAYAEPASTRYLEDDHLTRVGFMSTSEAEDWFEEHGLDPTVSAILIRGCEVPDWLTFGVHRGSEAVWKASEPPGDLVAFEFLLLNGMESFLCQPGWLDRVIEEAGAQQVAAHLRPELDPNGRVVACQRGPARVEFEVFQNLGILQLLPPGRRQFLVHDLALTRDLGQSFQRAQQS